MNNMLIEDLLGRALKEAQESEGLNIDEPIFLAYLDMSPSPMSLYADKYNQYFAIGDTK